MEGGWGRYSQLGTSLFGGAAPCSRVAAFPYLLLPQLRLEALGGPGWAAAPLPLPGGCFGGTWQSGRGCTASASLTPLSPSACRAAVQPLRLPLVAHQASPGVKVWAAFGAPLELREGACSALAGLRSAELNLSHYNPNVPVNLSLPTRLQEVVWVSP